MADNQSILGIRFGPDTSGNFRGSLEGRGLAVKMPPDDKYYVYEKGKENLTLVPTECTFDIDPKYICRLPVHRRDLKAGDIIITSDTPNPFNVLFVLHVHENGLVHGIQPPGTRYDYTPPNNLFIKEHIYIKVASVLDELGGGGTDNRLLSLALGSAASTGTNNNPLAMFSLLRGLKESHSGSKDLLALLALQTGGATNGMDLFFMMQLLEGRGKRHLDEDEDLSPRESRKVGRSDTKPKKRLKPRKP